MYLALRDGPREFRRGSTCPAVLGCPAQGGISHFVYGAITLYGRPFQALSTMRMLCNSPRALRCSPARSRDPIMATPASLTPLWFGLFPLRSPLLRESRLLSLPGATKMFQFAPFARSGLCIHPAVHGHDPMWVSPFRNSRIKACLAAPRDLSQPSTSFFAIRCQGIHQLPLITWPHNLSGTIQTQQKRYTVSFLIFLHYAIVRERGRRLTYCAAHYAGCFP